MADTLSIRDNRTGQQYEVPITDGTIRAADLKQVAVDDEPGLATYDPGFVNTASCRSSITYIDGDAGILEYRGYPIEQLAESSTFLEVSYLLLYGAGIAFFCFFYSAVQFNSEETAENLKRHGGFIPGIRPGKATENYFDYLISRVTVTGAAYLVLICLIPEILFSQAGVPFYLGGTSLLIVVNVTMDTVAQIQSHLIAHQYGDLIKKAKLKTSRKR